MQATRQQKAMKISYEYIHSLIDNNIHSETVKIYGGMCHKLPVLIRTCGLCQTLAFMSDKASKNDNRGKAHQLLLEHVYKILHTHNLSLNKNNAVDAVLQMNGENYMYAAKVILDHCIYLKRFAVSILKVENITNEEN